MRKKFARNRHHHRKISSRRNTPDYKWVIPVTIPFIIVLFLAITVVYNGQRNRVLGDAVTLTDRGEDFNGGDQGKQSEEKGNLDNTGERTNPEISPIPDKTEDHGSTSSGQIIRLKVKSLNASGQETEFDLENDNSHLNLKSKKSDGSETQLEVDSLEKVNAVLGKENQPEIEKSGTDSIALIRGNVSAQTALPISVNLQSKTLSVNTPSGNHTLRVLPDQAVENLINNNVISSLNNIAGATGSGTIELVQINNLPAFAINGALNKRFVGIIPVSIDKKIFVSAETGETIRTDESTVSKLLELISF